jgi:hypothetical protein
MVQLVRKDNPKMQLRPSEVGLATIREERKDREAFMVAYFKSADTDLYNKYRQDFHKWVNILFPTPYLQTRNFRFRRDLDKTAENSKEEEEEEEEEEEVKSSDRNKRSPKSRPGKNKRRQKEKKKYSQIEEDFEWGGGGSDSSNDNPYRDIYGGRYRNRHCQKRQFRVSFRDLGWQACLDYIKYHFYTITLLHYYTFTLLY